MSLPTTLSYTQLSPRFSRSLSAEPNGYVGRESTRDDRCDTIVKLQRQLWRTWSFSEASIRSIADMFCVEQSPGQSGRGRDHDSGRCGAVLPDWIVSFPLCSSILFGVVVVHWCCCGAILLVACIEEKGYVEWNLREWTRVRQWIADLRANGKRR